MSVLHKFHVIREGQSSDKKIVFLHGLMGSGANWKPFVRHFSNEFEVLAFDQRGHGKSHKPESGYSPEDYAQDLKEILDELGWDEIYLVGHSMGGRNALNFAHQYPERLKALVIEDIGPEASQKAVEKIKHLLELVPTPFANRAEARDFFKNKYAELIADNPQKEVLAGYFYSNIVEDENGLSTWRFSLPGILESMEVGRANDRWHEVENLSMPTLWIRGEHSDELSVDTMQKILDSNSGIEGVEVPAAAHWVHFEQPQEFIKALSSFFAKIS